MDLSKVIAQKIVEKMMSVIPYNINVMDERGIIIGSGDNKRIGTIHDGARKAIKHQSINEIYDNKEGMKPGVNEPIIYNEKIIGVIGITGHPDEVRKFSKLVCVTAVLLIEQSKIDEEIQNKRLRAQRFYHELSHRKVEYDEEFYQRAKNYGLDLKKGCEAILIEGNVNSYDLKTLCRKYSHYSVLDNNKIVFYLTNSQMFQSLIFTLKESQCVDKISIGGEEKIAAKSLENAEQAMEFGIRLKPSARLYHYEELKFFIHLTYEKKESILVLFMNLDKTGNSLELIQTIQAYIEENGDMNNVANRLNIHRNTLNYRLDKITKITGKNPKILLELFELLYGLLIWK